MTTLFDHLKQTQRFVRDAKQAMLDPEDIRVYVNRARREVAGMTQCIRRVTPISGSIEAWTVTAQGSGYSVAPVCSITPPDFPSSQLPDPNGAQATASAIVTGGQIVAVESVYGGAGYFQPQMTIIDSTGTGATAVPTVKFVNQLNRGQEVYNFSDIDLSMFPGVDSVLAVKSVSIIYANYRYSLPIYPFTTYQAMIRQYPFQYQYVPTFGSQLGQGNNGSFYFYPLPSQTYQTEWDCFCIPADLVSDQDFEPIPAPWDDTVPYFAAHLAYAELQNLNASRYYLDLFDKMVERKSRYARIGRVTNPYGRY